jgi:hypothetical protein
MLQESTKAIVRLVETKYPRGWLVSGDFGRFWLNLADFGWFGRFN